MGRAGDQHPRPDIPAKPTGVAEAHANVAAYNAGISGFPSESGAIPGGITQNPQYFHHWGNWGRPRPIFNNPEEVLHQVYRTNQRLEKEIKDLRQAFDSETAARIEKDNELRKSAASAHKRISAVVETYNQIFILTSRFDSMKHEWTREFVNFWNILKHNTEAYNRHLDRFHPEHNFQHGNPNYRAKCSPPSPENQESCASKTVEVVDQSYRDLAVGILKKIAANSNIGQRGTQELIKDNEISLAVYLRENSIEA